MIIAATVGFFVGGFLGAFVGTSVLLLLMAGKRADTLIESTT